MPTTRGVMRAGARAGSSHTPHSLASGMEKVGPARLPCAACVASLAGLRARALGGEGVGRAPSGLDCLRRMGMSAGLACAANTLTCVMAERGGPEREDAGGGGVQCGAESILEERATGKDE
eukprot:4254253-Prymnesium_polylepis.1